MATRTSVGSLHAHGCTQCRGRYEDTCGEPNSNALCRPCQGFRGWQVLIESRQPKDCCHLHSRPATKDELKTYRLSTACPWFRCSVCARTHPYRNPMRSQA